MRRALDKLTKKFGNALDHAKGGVLVSQIGDDEKKENTVTSINEENMQVTVNDRASLSKTKIENLKNEIVKLGQLGIKLNANGKVIKILTDKFTEDKNIFSKKGRTLREVNARIKAIPYFNKILKESKYSGTDTNIRGLDSEAKKGVVAMHSFKGNYGDFEIEALIRDKGAKQFLYEIKFIENEKSSQQSMTDKSASPAPKGDVENNAIISQADGKSNTFEKNSSKKSSSGINDRKSIAQNKQRQLEIIQETNPMWDDYHVGIRTAEDIRTWAEVLELNDESEGQFIWGDFSRADAEQALKDGTITVYSSYPIKNGVFVSTSYVQAQEYAGGRNGKVYSKTIPLTDVAWINGDEGQYASVEDINTRYSKTGSSSKGIDSNSKKVYNNVYTEYQYNSFGWVRANDILTSDQYKDFTQKFAQIKNGKNKNYVKSASGSYIIAIGGTNDGYGFGIDNVLVYATGTIAYPQVEKIVKIDLYAEDDINIVRSFIYAKERNKNAQASYLAEDQYGEELVSNIRREDLPDYQRYQSEARARRSGGESGGAYKSYIAKQDGERDSGEARADRSINDRSSKTGKDTVEMSRGEIEKLRANYMSDKVFDKKGVSDALNGITMFKKLPSDVRGKLIESIRTGFNEHRAYDRYIEVTTERLYATIMQESDFELYELDMKESKDAEMQLKDEIKLALQNIVDEADESTLSKMRKKAYAEVEDEIKALKAERDKLKKQEKRSLFLLFYY